MLCNRIHENDEFSIKSIHSVSLTFIEELYKIDETFEIINYETRYEDQGGAGMPDILSVGETFEIENGYFVVKRQRKIASPLYVLTDLPSQWSLSFENVNLEVVEDKAIEIDVKEISIMQRIYYKVLVWINED